jgi:hypothetical protein
MKNADGWNSLNFTLTSFVSQDLSVSSFVVFFFTVAVAVAEPT